MINKNFVKSKSHLPKNYTVICITKFFPFLALPQRKLWYKYIFAKIMWNQLFIHMLIDHSVNWFHEIFFSTLHSEFANLLYRFSVKSKFIFASNWNKKSYLCTKAPKLCIFNLIVLFNRNNPRKWYTIGKGSD